MFLSKLLYNILLIDKYVNQGLKQKSYIGKHIYGLLILDNLKY